MAGFAQAPIYAEESNANPPATTEQSNSKENKKDLSTKTEEEVATLPKDKAKEEAPKKEGWQEENKHWRFYENNQPVLKWKKIQDKWYYFDNDGNRLSDTIFDSYVLNKDGVMVENGWVALEGKWYYASESGKIIQQTWKKSEEFGTTLTKMLLCSVRQSLMVISLPKAGLWLRMAG